jgi:hypothetical protein
VFNDNAIKLSNLQLINVGEEMFRNSSWSSIRLFGAEYMYSFAHAEDVDFSFNWKEDWQESVSETNYIFGNSHRSRSWKNNL